MIAFIADASILLKPALGEPEADRITQLFATRLPGIPAIARVEIANVLRRMVKSQRMSRDRAKQALADLIATTVLLPETDEEAQIMLDLAISLDHSAQDCRYLAAAIAAKVPLVTADETFARKARAAGHDARTVSELPA